MDATRHTLIQRLKNQHDENAWQTFTDTYSSYIESVLVKVGMPKNEVVDLRQDILLKLWEKLPEFDFDKTKGKFRTWLWTMIRNTAYNHLSSRHKEEERVQRYFSDAQEDNSELSLALEELMQEEWKAFITARAMGSIKEKFAEQNIQMFREFLKGVDTNTLAEKYEVKRNTVNRVVSRIKERLTIEVAVLRKELEE